MLQESDFETFKPAIARIYGKNGRVVGAGFLVSRDCLLTCAHVITAALGLPLDTADKPGDVIHGDFLLSVTKEPFESTVTLWRPVQPGQPGEDMALLKLAAPLPGIIQPVSLNMDQSNWDSRIRMFGLPKDFDDGIWVTGTLRDGVGNGLVQMDAIAAEGDRSVEKGFSGAPVWEEATQTVVGMAIAAEKKRDAVTAAYMISAQTLLKYALEPLDRQYLLEFMAPYAAELLTTSKDFYIRLRPEDWRPSGAMPMPSLEGILEDLADMPDQEGFSPLHLWVVALAFEAAVPNLKSQLLNWIESKALSVSQHWDYFCRLKKLSERVIQSPDPYLMVLVKPSRQKPKEYFVDGWVLADSQRSTVTRQDESKQLVLPPLVNDKEVKDPTQTTFRVDEIPLIVEEFLNQIGGEGVIDLANLTVEVFVPLELLNQAIEGWPIADQFGGAATPLCRECCQVILRSYERLAKNYRSKKVWYDKWDYWQTVQQVPANTLFMPRSAEEHQNLAKLLKAPDAIAVKFHPENLSTARGGALSLILSTGVPIALWLREALACAPELEDLLDCCLQTVTERVTERRREAYDNDDDAHLGKHLSLVIENPYRLPPNIDYSL